MPYKPGEREYRTIAAPLALTNKPKNERRLQSDYYVEGIATTFDDPYILDEYEGVVYYEKVDRNAFAAADLSDIIMQYDHVGKVLARISNGSLIVEPTDTGLLMAADLSLSVEARNLYEEIKNGLITQMSLGFRVEDGGDVYDRESHTRTILKYRKVYDVSAVSLPANTSTTISARSYVEGSAKAWAQELRERDRQRLIFRSKLLTGGFRK